MFVVGSAANVVGKTLFTGFFFGYFFYFVLLHTLPWVPPLLVGDCEVCFMESGSTLDFPNLSCCAAVFRADITSLSFTL